MDPDREAVFPRLQVRLWQGDFLLPMGFPLSASNHHLSESMKIPYGVGLERAHPVTPVFFPKGGHELTAVAGSVARCRAGGSVPSVLPEAGVLTGQLHGSPRHPVHRAGLWSP